MRSPLSSLIALVIVQAKAGVKSVMRGAGTVRTERESPQQPLTALAGSRAEY